MECLKSFWIRFALIRKLFLNKATCKKYTKTKISSSAKMINCQKKQKIRKINKKGLQKKKQNAII